MSYKVLICASTISHIMNFHLPYIKYFKEKGFEVHIAVPGNELLENADLVHNISMTKKLLSINNVNAILQLRDLYKAYDFDILLTHTTLAGIIGRLAVLLSGNKNIKVIHTVHGYLFWNGCGSIKRLMYYLPELLLRNTTDCIITMNDEDTLTAQKLVKKAGLVEKVPGMGVNSERFIAASESEKTLKRQQLLFSDDAFVIVYAAEFSKRKNHLELIRAMSDIVSKEPNVILVLCGTGDMENDILLEVKRRDLQRNVQFMGWCDHMEEIYKACDMAISTSISEGLPFNIIEAQLCGLPVVASNIRGHVDLIKHGESGWLYTPRNPQELSNIVLDIINSSDQGKRQGEAAKSSANRYSLLYAYGANTNIYQKFIEHQYNGEI